MFWNFISWVIIIGVIVAVFAPDKIPAAKKYLDKIFNKSKK